MTLLVPPTPAPLTTPPGNVTAFPPVTITADDGTAEFTPPIGAVKEEGTLGIVPGRAAGFCVPPTVPGESCPPTGPAESWPPTGLGDRVPPGGGMMLALDGVTAVWPTTAVVTGVVVALEIGGTGVTVVETGGGAATGVEGGGAALKAKAPASPIKKLLVKYFIIIPLFSFFTITSNHVSSYTSQPRPVASGIC